MTSAGGSTSIWFGLNLMSSACGKLMTSSMSDGGQVTTMLAPAFSSRCQMRCLPSIVGPRRSEQESILLW